MFTIMKIALIGTCLCTAGVAVQSSPLKDQITHLSQTTQIESEEITVDKAMEIAAENQGFSVNDVTFTKTEERFDDGCREIRIVYVHGNTEYKYDIDGVTGVILDVSFGDWIVK